MSTLWCNVLISVRVSVIVISCVTVSNGLSSAVFERLLSKTIKHFLNRQVRILLVLSVKRPHSLVNLVKLAPRVIIWPGDAVKNTVTTVVSTEYIRASRL